MSRVCLECNKVFEPSTDNQKFCSKACSGSFQRKVQSEKAAKLKRANTEKFRLEYEKNPKRCKCCGQVIPFLKRKKCFCNSSCAAKYNNSHRTRKPWTEEQHKRVSLERRLANLKKSVEYDNNYLPVLRCKHCGTVLSRGERTVCSDCRGFNRYSIYKKLHPSEGTLKDRFEESKALVKAWYFEDKLSIPQIQEKTGLQTGTIRFLLTVDGECTRGSSEGQRVAIEQGRFAVNAEGFRYKTGDHKSWEGKTFHFRSSWEEKFMQELDEEKISYLYEPFSIRYFDTQKSVERVAIPDFFFPETNTILELKSSWTYDEQNMKDRFKSYREKGYKVKLLLDWKEIEKI